MVDPNFTASRAATHHAARRRPDRSRTTSWSKARSRGARLQRAGARAARTTTRCASARSSATVGQCNPTYFTVGNLVKYLFRLRDEEGHDGRAHRQALRLPDRRRLRPVPLRHVRDRVPQGAARRRLRRLPRDAVPADRAASSRPRARSSACRSTRRSSSSIAKALFAGDVINALGYRIRPYEVEPGATNVALEQAKREVYDALLNHKNVIAGPAARAQDLRARSRSTAPAPSPRSASSASSGR